MCEFSKLTESAASKDDASSLIEIKRRCGLQAIGGTPMSWLNERSHERPKCRAVCMLGIFKSSSNLQDSLPMAQRQRGLTICRKRILRATRIDTIEPGTISESGVTLFAPTANHNCLRSASKN
jgi:hypothetical protein